MFGALADL